MPDLLINTDLAPTHRMRIPDGLTHLLFRETTTNLEINERAIPEKNSLISPFVVVIWGKRINPTLTGGGAD
jgi:hypothetical protein